jgi:hypothetical protein
MGLLDTRHARDGVTRTDDGYAGWKDDLKRVKDARTQAAGIVGWQKIKAFTVAEMTPLLEWLATKLGGRK